MKLSRNFNISNTIPQITVKNSDDNLNARKISRLAFPLALVIILLMVLLFIEYKHPYFFLQDDNRDSYLPYFIHNYESLLEGEIALYNFHQFLGIPSLAIGQTAALYPITYLSVFLSESIFGHYFATVDIQVILHLMIGAVGCYRFIRFFRTDYRAAFFGGLTWSLSSFIIYVSNSWLIAATVAAYFPWMLLFSFHLYKKQSSKVTIYAVLVRLLLFYAGHIQYFIYSVIFEFITIITHVIYDSSPGEKKVNTFNFIKRYIESYIYVFIFSLPLLLPMWHLTTASAQRSSKLSFAVFFSQYFPLDQLIKGLFYPFLQVNENTYAPFRNMLNLSHIGYLTMTFLAVGIIEKFIKKSKNIKINSVRLCAFMIPALVALLWSTNWIFNIVIYCIPILNRFRWPFKLAFYFDFYLIIIAMLLLSHFIEQLPWKKMTKNLLFCLIIGIQIFNFILLYTSTPYKDFGEHHGDKLPLEEKLKDKLIGGRIISIGFDTWSPTPQNNHSYLTAPTLGFNYATLWGLDYFAGYEVMLSQANLNASLGLNFTAIVGSSDPIQVDSFRKAAVRWYIVPKSKVNEYSKKLNTYGIIKKYEDENRVIFYDIKAYPMVFNSSGEKIESKDYHVTTNSIELSVDLQKSDSIIFNNIYNPFFEGFIDGEETMLKPINGIHFSISVPKGKHHILIKYKDPYLISGIYCVAVFLISIGVVRMVQIWLKRNRYLRIIEDQNKS